MSVIIYNFYIVTFNLEKVRLGREFFNTVFINPDECSYWDLLTEKAQDEFSFISRYKYWKANEMLPIAFFMCRATISSITSSVSCFFTCEPYLDEQNHNEFFCPRSSVKWRSAYHFSTHTYYLANHLGNSGNHRKKNEIRIRKRIRIEESGSDLTFKVLFYILLVIEQCISYVRDVY